MMRKLNDRTVITEAIQSAVQQEIENFLQTNFQTLNQELLDDIYNDELAREVEEQLIPGPSQRAAGRGGG